MIALQVTLKVKEDDLKAFIEACKANAAGTDTETGNVRFDMYQAGDDPTSFILFEVYETQEAMEAHMESEHFKTWREATSKMIVNSGASNLTPVFLKGAEV